MAKIKVGQKLFSLNVGNAARNQKSTMTPVTVTKVGWKYFTTQDDDDTHGGSATQFHIDTWGQKSDYCATRRLYGTLQEQADEEEAAELRKKVVDILVYNNKLKVKAWRNIWAIIEEHNHE